MKLKLKNNILLISILSCSNFEKEYVKMNYPETKKNEVLEVIFGKKIPDPYRWLEDETSYETKKWVVQQNNYTDNYLSRIPFLKKIEDRLKNIWNYPSESIPIAKDDNLYYFYNDGLKNQSILRLKSKDTSKDMTIIDPNLLSSDGSKSIGGLYFSNDHKYLGYTINKSGSDWQVINVMRLEDQSLVKDTLKRVKFSGIEWFKRGFFYKRYPEAETNKILSKKISNSKIYYHNLGDKQENDILVKTPFTSEYISPYVSVSEDEKVIFLYGYRGTYGNSLYYKKSNSNENNWISLVKDYNSDIQIVRKIKDHIYVLTDRNSQYKKLVKIYLDKPGEEDWVTLIEGKENEVLKEIKITGNKIFAHFYKDVLSCWKIFNLRGKILEELELPGKGIVNGFDGDLSSKITYYSFNNLITPYTIYKYDIINNKSEIYKTSKIKFDSKKYILKQEFYTSKDGTKVPIFICHRKGLLMDGKRPTLLYGYGGFNISIEPYFNKSNAVLLENDGVYAIANIRGGGEYGQKWHSDGMLEKKQNVFDDFIFAAKYLIKKGITSENFLGIQGQSNGGLLIGAVLNQRPELFKVAFPEVGVMDMIRYEKFTIGHAWNVEYGSVKDKNHFEYIYKYSPLHNIDSGINYPSMLIYTADHDDRVVPAHSFKYAASIQSLKGQKNPALIRIGVNVGHGFGKPVKKIIKENAEKWAYFFYEMGVSY